MYHPDPNWARDFSAYYQASWRLIHNPSTIYSSESQAGDYPVGGLSEVYKYTPSFLIMSMPFLLLGYQDALFLFNLLQLLLVFIMAFFVYVLIKKENLTVFTIISTIVLLQPLPFIIGDNQSSFRVGGALYASYNLAWLNANAHVLQTVLIVGAIFFLVYNYRPFISASLFSFGCFDPRMGLLALPILLWYSLKIKKSKRFIFYSVLFIIIENLPFFFYNNVGQSFLAANLNLNFGSRIYAYEWIPIYSILSLSTYVFFRFNVRRKGKLP